MYIEADIPTFTRWFSFVKGAVANKISRPILKNVLLTAQGDTLTLRASDGNLELVAYLPVKVIEEGSFAVDPLISSPMQFFKQSEPVIIKVSERSAVISQGSRTHKFACFDSLEFPEEVVVKDYTLVKEVNRLVKILKTCETSYTRLARRKILKSYSINPHVCATVPDTEGAYILSGDGNRLVCFEGIKDINLDGFPIFGNIALPEGESLSKGISEISNLVEKDEFYVSFGQVSGFKAKVWNEENKDFSSGWELKTTSQKGEYPNSAVEGLRKHVKADNHYLIASFDKNELKEKLQVCQIYLNKAKSEGFGEGTDFIVKDNKVTFDMSIDNDSVQMHEPVEVKEIESQGDVSIKFHSKDLLDLVEQTEDGLVTLKLTTAAGPIILLDSDEQKFYMQGPLS